MEFREKLGRLMREHGHTQTSLGKKLGLSQRAVGKWQAGDSEPSPDMARKLAAELGVPVELLMNPAHELPPPSNTSAFLALHEPGTKYGELSRVEKAALSRAVLTDHFDKNPELLSALAALPEGLRQFFEAQSHALASALASIQSKLDSLEKRLPPSKK